MITYSNLSSVATIYLNSNSHDIITLLSYYNITLEFEGRIDDLENISRRQPFVSFRFPH